MSNNKSTKDLILEKALKMFNHRGIEYVGVREIASELSIRVGNITYYFPTKDDIILGLAIQLREENSKVNRKMEQPSITGFLKIYEEVYKNQYTYRCLPKSMVNLLAQNSRLSEFYQNVEGRRRHTLGQNIQTLISSGYLKKELSPGTVEYIVSNIALVSRFWISEAAISYPGEPAEKLISRYLVILAGILEPHTTEKGKMDIGLV